MPQVTPRPGQSPRSLEVTGAGERPDARVNPERLASAACHGVRPEAVSCAADLGTDRLYRENVIDL